MLFKFLKIGTTLHKPKSIWSTFKNAYLRRRNLKKFWLKLNKNKLPNELIVMTDLFIQSESYFWTSKFWRHCIINHYKYMSELQSSDDPLHSILRSDYSGFTFLDEFSLDDNLKKKENFLKFKEKFLAKYPNIKKKKHEGLSELKSTSS